MSTITFDVTYYNLFLGDQDGTTGHYQKGYTVEAVTAAIIPKTAAAILAGFGLVCRMDAMALTNYAVKNGGVLKDAFGDYWEIVGDPMPFTWGSYFGYYQCQLKRKLDFPFIAGFFGFEDEAHSGYAGSEFEDGFERGYWAL